MEQQAFAGHVRLSHERCSPCSLARCAHRRRAADARTGSVRGRALVRGAGAPASLATRRVGLGSVAGGRRRCGGRAARARRDVAGRARLPPMLPVRLAKQTAWRRRWHSALQGLLLLLLWVRRGERMLGAAARRCAVLRLLAGHSGCWWPHRRRPADRASWCTRWRACACASSASPAARGGGRMDGKRHAIALHHLSNTRARLGAGRRERLARRSGRSRTSASTPGDGAHRADLEQGCPSRADRAPHRAARPRAWLEVKRPPRFDIRLFVATGRVRD